MKKLSSEHEIYLQAIISVTFASVIIGLTTAILIGKPQMLGNLRL